VIGNEAIPYNSHYPLR